MGAQAATQTGRRGTKGVGREEVVGGGVGLGGVNKMVDERQRNIPFSWLSFHCSFGSHSFHVGVISLSRPLSRLTSWPLPSVTLSFPGSALTLMASIKMTRKRQAVASKTTSPPPQLASAQQRPLIRSPATPPSFLMYYYYYYYCCYFLQFWATEQRSSGALNSSSCRPVEWPRCWGGEFSLLQPESWELFFFGCWMVKATLPSYNSPFLSLCSSIFDGASKWYCLKPPTGTKYLEMSRVAFQLETCRITDLSLNRWALGIKLKKKNRKEKKERKLNLKMFLFSSYVFIVARHW